MADESKMDEKIPLSRAILEILVMLVLIGAMYFGITNFVAVPYNIPSASMETTIMTGDKIISEKITYEMGNKPQRGDIITFNSEWFGEVLIKRVVATEGETVDLRDGRVYIDGELLDEPYAQGRSEELWDSGLTFPYTVGKDRVFVMGDNREDSWDSRGFGDVPISCITGRTCFRYWPFTSFGPLNN